MKEVIEQIVPKSPYPIYPFGAVRLFL